MANNTPAYALINGCLSAAAMVLIWPKYPLLGVVGGFIFGVMFYIALGVVW